MAFIPSIPERGERPDFSPVPSVPSSDSLIDTACTNKRAASNVGAGTVIAPGRTCMSPNDPIAEAALPYSITSSATASKFDGNSTPIDLAVLG